MIGLPVRKLALLSALLLASPSFACRLVYCPQRLAPAHQLTLPANAQCVVASGKPYERFDPLTGEIIDGGPWIQRIDADGGQTALTPAPLEVQPSGFYGEATLFSLGPVAPGDRLRLESSRDCGRDERPFAEILVVDAAPIPEQFGAPVSPPSTRIEPAPNAGASCDPSVPITTRDLFIDIDESVRPWLGVARVNMLVNGTSMSTDYGRLARGFDGGTRVLVDRLVRTCVVPGTGAPDHSVQTWPVWLELEIPGDRGRRPYVEFSVDMDCSPGCSSAGGVPWLLGAALWWRRRRRAPEPV